MLKEFTRKLMAWHFSDNTRTMPWKGQTDPYRIWISEIILQQTRVAQGITYYNNFLKAFPTLKKLALANDAEVYKMWEGLGYYSRCKNLISTARYIQNELLGKFPATYEEIIKLKGIGPYTAAAIASFAFNLPHAVVDGNVYRVLARYFGEFMPIDTIEGKKLFSLKANNLLDKKDPAGYNQAIMDFGANICKPQPLCGQCPLQKGCTAYKNDWVLELPVKSKLKAKKKRWLYYFIISINGKYLVNKRVKKDIWQNLHEFYLAEMPSETNWTKQKLHKFLQEAFPQIAFEHLFTSPTFSQTLTHQQLSGQFIHVQMNEFPFTTNGEQLYTLKEMKTLAFPKFINQYMSSAYFN